MKIVNNKIVFESTNRQISLPCGDDTFSFDGEQIRTGYDNTVVYDFEPLSKDEKIEIAKYVISQWSDFAGLQVEYR